MNKEQAERLAIAKIKCDKDLLFFTRFFFKELKGTKFIVGDHHQKISKALTRVEKYELDLLNINIPPRYSKTELAAVNFIARGLARNPRGNYLYITASDELRSQTSVGIRDIVSSHQFRSMYNVELKKDQNGKNLWRTKQGGGVKTATILGQITGFGAGQMIEHDEDLKDYIRDFEGCIVIDDGNKIDDTEQDNANNEKIIRVLFNTILSRKNSKDTPIINIQQRAGMNDITAALNDHYGSNDRVMNLVLPIINEDGTPLWKWKHDLDAIEELKNSPRTAHVFETQYMQNPVPLEGLLLPKDELKYFTMADFDHEKVEAAHSYTDSADEGKDHWCTGYAQNIGKEIYLTDVIFTQDNADSCIPRIANLIFEKKCRHNKIEINREGRMVIKLIRSELKTLMGESDESYNITGKWSTGKKHTRIISTASMVKTYVHFRSDYKTGTEYDLFMRALTTYRKDGQSKHDDAPDMMSGLITFITQYLSHLY